MFRKFKGTSFVIKGGIGNQLFQVATGINYSVKYDVPIKLDTSWYSRTSHLNLHVHDFDIETDVFCQWWINPISGLLESQILNKISSNQELRIVEESMTYTPLNFARNGATFDGFWQSERYFLEIKPQIIELLRRKLGKSSEPGRSALHIRRGDFLKSPYRDVHNILDVTYYNRALESFHNFGDINWTGVIEKESDLELEMKDLLKSKNAILQSGKSILEDLSFLSTCERIVIANSTFSWWGAYLSGSDNVVAPRKWFTDEYLRINNLCDLFPDKWRLV
jgi:hypothetical protein